MAATKHWNQMPLPLCSGAPIFLGSDVTMFLHKYVSLAAFTSTDPTSSDAVTMFPYYSVEGSDVRDTVIMMRGYVEPDWAVLRTEMLDAFRLADRRSRDVIYTRRHHEDFCTQFERRDYPETLKFFLRTYDYISGVVTERGMMVEYERTEMLLCALPKRLWRKAITKIGLNPLDPRTFEYGKLNDWVTSKISAAEAVDMVEFLSPAAANPTTLTSPNAPPTSPASIYSINSTPLATSPASTVSPTSITAPAPLTTFPALATSPTSIASPAPLAPPASTSSTAPTSTSGFPFSSTPATPKTHTTSLALATSPAPTASPTSIACPAPLASLAPFAPAAAETTTTIPMAAKVPLTTAIITTLPSAPSPAARQGTIRAGPTVRLGIIAVEPPGGPQVRRHCFVQPKHHQEASLPNRHVPDKQHRPRQVPDQQHRQQPTSPFNQKPAPPPSHQDPVRPPQQRDVTQCHYYSAQHHLRNCLDLHTDLENGVVSINNRGRLVPGRAGLEIPMAPAARGDRTMRDYTRAGSPVLSTPPPPPPPSPSPPLPPSSSLTAPPSPLARPVSPAPSPARPTRPSAPLLSTEQLTQLMQEVLEHFA